MKKRIFLFLMEILMAIAMTLPVAAESINVSGGSGITGQGTYANGWCVSDGNGWYTFDAEGLRVYLVDYKTGKPIAGKKAIDITNYDFDVTQIWFSNYKTKYDYLYGGQALILGDKYWPIHLSSSSLVGKLPNIIPWNETDSTSRMSEIRLHFLNPNFQDWLFQQLSTTREEVETNGYAILFEPIAYFRYMGTNFALTATECAMLDKMKSGDLYCKLNPLTHSNLPISMFLEDGEFADSSTPLKAYSGSTVNAKFRDNDQIIRELGIGCISYEELTGLESPESDPEDFPTLDLPITLEAEPDGQEVTGEAGYPANLTENVTLKLSMPLGEAELSKWEEVLLGGETTEKVDEVNVEIKLQSMQYQTVNGTERYIGARDNFKFTGGSVPSSAKSSLSALNREYTSIKMSGEALKK